MNGRGNENFRLLVEAFRWGSQSVPYEVAICAAIDSLEDTVERTVNWERPHRRPATVNRARRKTAPRKAASSWG